MLTKSFLRFSQVANKLPTRQFSALLVPLAKVPDMPSELKTTPITNAEFAALEVKY